MYETQLYLRYYFLENVLKDYKLNVMKCCYFRNVHNFQYIMNIVQRGFKSLTILQKHFNLYFQKGINKKKINHFPHSLNTNVNFLDFIFFIAFFADKIFS